MRDDRPDRHLHGEGGAGANVSDSSDSAPREQAATPEKKRMPEPPLFQGLRRRPFPEELAQERSKLWLKVFVVAAILAGGAWLGYPHFRGLGGMLERFPGMQQTVASLGDRMSKVESGLKEWIAERESLRVAVARLEDNLEKKFESARKWNEKLSARLRTEFDARANAIASRVGRLEEAERAEGSRLARLEGELAGLRQQLGQQRTQLATIEKNALDDKETLAERVSGLGRRLTESDNARRSFEKNLEMQRVDFELSRGRSREIMPGVSVCVTGTSVARRQLKGWIWVMPDRKTIWLRDQNVMQPVIFHSQADGKRREVVFTHVTKQAAVGYGLRPSSAGSPLSSGSGADASGSTSTSGE